MSIQHQPKSYLHQLSFYHKWLKRTTFDTGNGCINRNGQQQNLQKEAYKTNQWDDPYTKQYHF